MTKKLKKAKLYFEIVNYLENDNKYFSSKYFCRNNIANWLVMFCFHRSSSKRKGDVLREVSDNVVGALISGFLRIKGAGSAPKFNTRELCRKMGAFITPQSKGMGALSAPTLKLREYINYVDSTLKMYQRTHYVT